MDPRWFATLRLINFILCMILTVNLIVRYTATDPTTYIPSNMDPNRFFVREYMGPYYGQIANSFQKKFCAEPTPPAFPEFPNAPVIVPTATTSAIDTIMFGFLSITHGIQRLRAVNHL
ncbi:hypothetical protein BSKO_10308 [Bryopsis sp. KO-2023]|nr:hypothetical protein BSKO_10308 [Bryopsis sp. KO-2023]